MKVRSSTVIASGKWLRLRQLQYGPAEGGALRSWEAVERTTTAAGQDCDAVAVFPRLQGGPGAPETLLVRQFRPPLGCETLENVAGLVDAGETCEEAAVRELAEETGYHGSARWSTPVVHCDPGLSTASFRFVFVDVDLREERNQRPAQRLEPCEAIAVLRVPIAGLRETLERLAREEGLRVDAKCYALALGMALRD